MSQQMWVNLELNGSIKEVNWIFFFSLKSVSLAVIEGFGCDCLLSFKNSFKVALLVLV